MEKPSRLKELIAQNPQSEEQVSRIEEAITLVRQMRCFGIPEKQYELDSPYGDREWLRSMRVIASRG